MVVVIEERGAERACVLDRSEPSGERRAVLERLELGLAVGVVVGHVGAAVGSGDAEVDEQLGDDTRASSFTIPAAGSITKVQTGAVAGTSAVVVNLTMTDGTQPGYITADRCSALTAGAQTKSSGNHDVGKAIANLAIVPVDPDGSFCIFNQQSVNLVVDLQGSFTSSTGALGFAALTPIRKLDTRVAPASRPVAGAITKVFTGVEPGATAVLANLTMVDGIASGFITADKCSAVAAGPQTKSSGNFVAGTAIANLAVVPVDADGSFCVYNSQPVNLVVDVQGAFSPTGAQRFFTIAPKRVLDTRS